MQYHKQAVKREALAVCRRPATLGAAFVTGGLLAYILGPSGKKISSSKAPSEQSPGPKGPIRRAVAMALISYLFRALSPLPDTLQRRQMVDAASREAAAPPVV